MGTHNRITKTRYNQIKKNLKTPADDANAMREFGICATSCRNIRLTKNYDEYCERVFRYHGHPKGTSRYQAPAFEYEPDDTNVDEWYEAMLTRRKIEDVAKEIEWQNRDLSAIIGQCSRVNRFITALTVLAVISLSILGMIALSLIAGELV